MDESKKTILSNISYLSILNALNLALPLVMVPYLTNTIGATHFGDYSYVLVVVQNMMMLTAYGFNFSATRQISTNREDRQYVNNVFSSTITAKLSIAIVCFFILFIFHPLLFNTPERLFLFITAMGMVIGDALIPIWLFQGMERMKYVTISTATARLTFTALVFVAITEVEHYKYILMLDSIGYLLAGVISISLAYKQFGVSFLIPSLKDVVKQLKGGFTVFCSTFFISLYRNLNVFILDFFVSPASVGIYALAEKVVKAAQSIVTPISQALYPRMGKIFMEHSLQSNIRQLLKICLILGIGTSIIAAMLVACSGYIHYVVGDDFIPARSLMIIMSPVLVFGAINYLLGFVGLVNLGKQKNFFNAVMCSGMIAIGLLLILVKPMGVTAAAISMTVSEMFLFVCCLIALYRIKETAKG